MAWHDMVQYDTAWYAVLVMEELAAATVVIDRFRYATIQFCAHTNPQICPYVSYGIYVTIWCGLPVTVSMACYARYHAVYDMPFLLSNMHPFDCDHEEPYPYPPPPRSCGLGLLSDQPRCAGVCRCMLCYEIL